MCPIAGVALAQQHDLRLLRQIARRDPQAIFRFELPDTHGFEKSIKHVRIGRCATAMIHRHHDTGFDQD